MKQITRELWLKNQDTPFGRVRFWVLRDYTKGMPLFLYFWDTPENFWKEAEQKR